MLKKINQKYEAWQERLITGESFDQSLQSYLGILKHCNGHKIEKEIAAVISGFPPARE